MSTLTGRLRRDLRGGVSVEFAFVATILIAALAAVTDLMSISSINREIERSSTQIAAVLARCPPAADSSCWTTPMTNYLARTANTLVRMPTATVSIAQVAEASGALSVCGGNMTYVPTDVAASALAVMNDKDKAFIVLIQTNYSTIIPNVTKLFTGQSSQTSTLRGWTTSVSASNTAGC